LVVVQAAVARKGFQVASKTVESLAGYDFIGLMTRILVFYVVAIVIAKVMELIIFASAGLTTASRLFGIPLPNNVPDVIRKLFDEGYDVGGAKIKFWDLVKLLSVLLVIMEMLNFIQIEKAIGRKPAPTTLGVFVLIIAALTLISVPDLIQMIREKQVIGR